MRLKALMLIVCGGGLAIGLLVVRQQRLQAMYEMTRSLERAAADEAMLLRLRAKIAEATRPEEIHRMAASLGPMIPIPREVCETEPRLRPRRANPSPDALTAADSGSRD